MPKSALGTVGTLPCSVDAASRQRKAAKILAVLDQAQVDGLLPGELSSLRCLDVGCGSALIARTVASRARWVIGVERDFAVLSSPDVPDALLLVCGDALDLPLADETVDLVVCAQVYEHVLDVERLAAEVARVLVPGGVCFFSGPNRLDPIERHYRLPFLSWLPRAWAGRLVHMARRGHSYEERPLSYWSLRRLWKAFRVVDYTVALIREPERFHCLEELGGLRWVGKLPRPLLRSLRPFYPNYNWLLIKPARRAT